MSAMTSGRRPRFRAKDKHYLVPTGDPRDKNSKHRKTALGLIAPYRRAAFTGALSEDPENHVEPAENSKNDGLSALESLPSELLQDIFALCPNLNLPLASLALGQRLASTMLKQDVFLSITTYDWTKLMPAEMSNAYAVEDQISCQNRILRMPWVTWDFVANTVELPSGLGFEVATPQEGDLQRRKLKLKTGHCLHARLPSRLLHGPWSEDKMKLLRLMKASRCHVDTLDSDDMEVISLELTKAIEDGDEDLIGALQATSCCDHRMTMASASAWSFNGAPVSTTHFLTAFSRPNFQIGIVLALLKGKIDLEIDPLNPQLWNAARRQILDNEVLELNAFFEQLRDQKASYQKFRRKRDKALRRGFDMRTWTS